jgi:tellurite resistance protein TerC
MLALNTENINIEASLAVRVGRKLFPIHSEYDGQRFFTRVDGKRYATPLFLVLLLVESADAVFALDSIPAIFAITTDPFIVFTSNVFAILGLRSLYFALAAIVHKFKYLKFSLAFLLAYVGVKMVLTHHYKIEPAVSLAIIGTILGLGIVASLVSDRGARPASASRTSSQMAPTRFTVSQARMLALLVIGTTVLALVMVLLSETGPRVVVLPVGAAVLAIESLWAWKLLSRYRRPQRPGGNDAPSQPPHRIPAGDEPSGAP